MIVCSCNVFSDADVRSALEQAQAPHTTVAQIYRGLGHAPLFGRCAGSIRDIVQETRATVSG
jgi:bacterioferritin-associated ferredoxin